MKYNGIVIADLHVGVMDLNKFHEEFNGILISEIQKMKKLDFLIIAGDYFDHKFYLNDRESTMAYYILNELIDACKEKNTEIRIVYGTESHECNQYDILSLLKIYDKIRVIKQVTEEELLPDLNVLYLPEEHILDKSEYYKKYFENDKKYDYVFGHGVIREVMKDIAVHIDTSSNTKRKKVPVFTTAELNKICKGQVFFGHYHINQNINDKYFSIGSFSRWKFGEEGVKGYYKLNCKPDKEEYEAIHIENTMAQSFKTIGYGYNSDIFKNEETLQNTLNRIDKMVSDDVFDNVRFEFNIPNTIENPEATINYLKERYKFKKNIKVEITHGYIEEKKERQKTEIQKENEKYSFIFNKSLPLEEVVSRFITIEYDKNIPTDRVDKYMNSPLTDILN